MSVPPRLPPDAAEIARRLIACRFTADEIAARVRGIHEAVRRSSARITSGNFDIAAAEDLALLFDLYDRDFFAGDLRRMVATTGAPLAFEFSGRLTRSAGLTKRFAPRHRRGAPPPAPSRFEIVLSSTLLFQTFRDVERTVRVNGLVCYDRLEAAQRVFEHELMHLLEMLVWAESSCTADRYKGLVWNVFGHTQTRHDLVTQQERARAKFDVKVGDRVTFDFDGARHTGVVNRITRRATVLVESPAGTPFSDGKRYLKFYVPLPMLTRVT
ncbi:MAG: hypothetical protein U0736_09525 [Gemmataceae bacterium]